MGLTDHLCHNPDTLCVWTIEETLTISAFAAPEPGVCCSLG